MISGFYHGLKESLLFWVVKQHRLMLRYAKILQKNIILRMYVDHVPMVA